MIEVKLSKPERQVIRNAVERWHKWADADLFDDVGLTHCGREVLTDMLDAFDVADGREDGLTALLPDAWQLITFCARCELRVLDEATEQQDRGMRQMEWNIIWAILEEATIVSVALPTAEVLRKALAA